MFYAIEASRRVLTPNGLLYVIDHAWHPVLSGTFEAVRDVPGERNSKNRDFVEAVAEANVRLTVERIRELSPILRGMETEGQIGVVGCIYSLDTGRVRFLGAPSGPK